MPRDSRPLIVGIGGGWRAGSTTEQALRVSLAAAERAGADTICFSGDRLANFPIYCPGMILPEDVCAFVDVVRNAHGVILATPGYHGGMSGMVKNALDMLEETSRDPRPYLDGRAVGCIVTGFGWQTCGTTLSGMRSIVHALRGWPTPMAAALNVSDNPFGAPNVCTDPKALAQLETVARQVVAFAVSDIGAPCEKAPEMRKAS